MGRVSTNSTGVLIADEAAGTPGTLPGSPTWYKLEPNNIDEAGATLTTTPRRPISTSRRRRKGKSTDKDSGMKFTMDTTWWHLVRLVPKFMFDAEQAGAEVRDPSAATSTAYTVAAGTTYAAGTLVYGRGFAISGNNGLKVVDASASGTSIPIVGGLTAETAPTNATVEEAGVRGATGDFEIDSNGDLISTTFDFTTLRFEVGQFIHVGGLTTTNQFGTAGAGFARISAVAANKLTLARSSFATDNGSGKQIDILYGPFIRDIDSDDASYDERTQQGELSYPNLGTAGATNYEYCIGNLPAKLAINLPLTALSTLEATWVGTDTEDPTATQKTNASTPIEPSGTDGMSTATDLQRLRILDVDESALTTDIKSATLNLDQGTTGEKVLSQLGPRYLNTSLFSASVEMQLVFTDPDVVARINANTTVEWECLVSSDDGAVMFDIPSATLGGGGKDFVVDAGVLLNVTLDAFEDAALGYSFSASFFPTIP